MITYDVAYHAEHATIEPHFCREWECFGTNPDHGMTLDEACNMVAEWYEEQARLWRAKEHWAVRYYNDQ